MYNDDTMHGVGPHMIPKYDFMVRDPERREHREEIREERQEEQQVEKAVVREARAEKQAEPPRQPERPESEAQPTTDEATAAHEAERSYRIAQDQYESSKGIDTYA